MNNFYITCDEGKGAKRFSTHNTSYQQAVNDLNMLKEMASCKIGVDAIEESDDQLIVYINGHVVIYAIQRTITLLSPKLFTQNINCN